MTDDNMSKAIGYAAGIVTAAIYLGASVLFTGCNGGGSEAMSPEATVEAFSRHIVSGEIDKALCLCDTTAMKEYIDGWTQTWERLEKEDSNALAIASSVLAGADFRIERTEKTDSGREVYYTINSAGESRSRKATLRKEEGEWRVETIKDVI